MNKAKLKSYAPQARKDFIAAVTARAPLLGLDDQHGQLKVAPAQTQGDVTLIAGQAWPAKVDGQRQQLVARMQREGFDQTVEAVAYTWFNRFAALRYMELHDYLGHGHRALSSREGGLPEILAHASELAQAGDLPGLKASQVNELKLAGNRDGELYRLLIIAQCNALHQAMPFLFERIDDETELLLPDNLLLSDSVIAKLVAEIPEEDWAEVEVIGWLYQFYISEKKDQVIGKVVKSEDIPAATQLFTPNWIVQYLVQNSVGRLWLMANPGSTLASQWPYYIQPAEQTPEVQAQLDALIQTRIREDGETLNPETITVLDPACGSGHILVVAYDVLKAIYLERGYQPRTIPRLILEKNLYGLDIDDRAAQLAGFALLMKARADDRRLFNDPPKLNVLSLQSSAGLNYEELCTHLAPFGVQRHTIWGLIEAFEHAKTFGSLIQIPYQLQTQLEPLAQVLALVQEQGDLYAQQAARDLVSLVLQAEVLAHEFDAVVANPPYMGNKYLAPVLKSYLKANYAGYEKDLFSAFMIRDLSLAKQSGQLGFMSPFVWMFISSYEELRTHLIEHVTLTSLVQLEYSGFDGATVPICTFTLGRQHVDAFLGSYVRLSDFRGADLQGPKTLEAIQNKQCGWFYTAKQDDFSRIPSSPFAFWIEKKIVELFSLRKLSDLFEVREGLGTRDDAIFMRFWWEVSLARTRKCSGGSEKWILADKAGQYRRWYGNQLYVLNWDNDGHQIKNHKNPDGSLKSRPQNTQYFFREAVSWGKVGSGITSFRHREALGGFTDAAPSIFGEGVKNLLGLLNSAVFSKLLEIQGGTLNVTLGMVGGLPLVEGSVTSEVLEITNAALSLSKHDWNEFEISMDFSRPSFVNFENTAGGLSAAWNEWRFLASKRRADLKALETQNNRIFINAYGLQEEVSPEVPDAQIVLACADREKDSQRLISYAIGCMMGRYSLDEPGLIYAHAGNVGFDPSRYEKKFPADADGIVPLTDEPWFTDDAASRVREFLRAVWGPDTLEENMAWLAESLGVKGSETPDETIRRYLADKFFKDHLQTYKKRPIYWLFSSGKQGAFQALVYLHRYHEGTLARLRAEYVVPLTGKMQARLDMLQKDAQAATSTAARNKISKETEKLKKKHLELLAYDEKLRHYADMRITLDLDDGVKVNYGKFGDLLAEVKAVTGGASDD